MRANRGFTLLELMVVVAISAIVAGLVVWQGRSAKQAAGLAGGAYDLALRLGGLKARALADGREYVLVVVDAKDPSACKRDDSACGRIVVLRNPDGTFAVPGLNPEAAVTGAEYFDDGGVRNLPRNAQLDLASTWRAPVPFDAITAFEPTILHTCSDGRRCVAIRFKPDGDVRPVLTPGTAAPGPGGLALVIRPTESQAAVPERRAIFVSFPAGLVKTAAF